LSNSASLHSGVHRTHFAGEVGAVANGGGALGGDQVALLVVVLVVTALKAGGAGELGVFHHVVERYPLVDEHVAAVDAGTVEPPLVAAEDQV
jgi:hypothetical protein